jgi:hypothetical protein
VDAQDLAPPSRRPRRWRWILAGIVTLALLASVTITWTTTIGCGFVQIRVQGRVVDAGTGASVEGAEVLVLADRRDADDKTRIAELRSEGFEALAHSHTIPARVGFGRTDASGAFDIRLRASRSTFTSELGGCELVRRESYPDVRSYLETLLVDHPAYARATHVPVESSWSDTRDGDVFVRADVGTIRLFRRPPP